VFNSVMVGVDGGPGGRDALALAGQLGPAARLTLVHVSGEPGGRSTPTGSAPASAESGRRANGLLHRHAWVAPPAGTVATHDTAPTRGLRRTVARRGADLLVLGSSHRAALGRVLLLAGTLEELEGLLCPVAIAPRGHAFASPRLRRIGVIDDGGPGGRAAATRAGELARSHQAQVRVLRDTDQVAALAEDSGRLDLLVVGAATGGGRGRVCCDETVSALARRSHCPLFVVPAPPAAHRARPEPERPPRDLHAPGSRRSPWVLSSR
jgi:nucleotide-binding universal stress UspA family protein